MVPFGSVSEPLPTPVKVHLSHAKFATSVYFLKCNSQKIPNSGLPNGFLLGALSIFCMLSQGINKTHKKYCVIVFDFVPFIIL